MNLTEQLQDLLNKPVWTPEENRLVLDYLETGTVEELAALLKQRFLKEMQTNVPEKDTHVLEMLSQLHKRMREEVLPKPVSFLYKYRALIAAAAVLILLGSLFLVFQQSGKTLEIKIAHKEINDIPAGSNRAILTLGNGSSIILDSAKNGTLAKQGTANIIKTYSGHLVYHLTEEKSSELIYNTLSTPRGGQYQISLPDETKVWLNAASSISFPTAFNGKERKVIITGEAYFEVVHNNRQPFVVSVNGIQVHDIGTRFNINAYTDETSVNTTLIEGSVKISKGAESAILKPGEQALVAGVINVLPQVDIDKVMAWQRGKISMNTVSVQQFMREISRWYDVDVIYAGKVPEGQFFGSINRNVPLSSVLRVMKVYGVETKLEGKKLTVF